MNDTGILYIVATPIGNLEDITLRALRILKEVDLIAAEDTRQTIKLLNHFGISTKLTSYHEHNKYKKGEHLIDELQSGKNIALVSDAGTPGISDPGEDIIKLAIENSISVISIPGPTAAISGLLLSGMDTGRFVFEGFLPIVKSMRIKRLEAIKNETRTIVLYEAPHKLIRTLNELYDVLGDRPVALVREITKRYEEVIRCMLKDALEKYETDAPKGEFVLVIDGANEDVINNERQKKWEELPLKDHLEMYLKEGMDKMDAIKLVAKDRGKTKREIYKSLL